MPWIQPGLKIKAAKTAPNGRMLALLTPPSHRAPGNTTRGQAFGLVRASPLDP